MKNSFSVNSLRGFTILELAITLLIIGLLMGFAVKGKAIIDSSKRKSDMQKINKLYTAVTIYQSAHDTLPGVMHTGSHAGKISGDSFFKTLIDEGLMREADFKLSGFGVSYLHIVGCEDFIDSYGNYWWKTVDASEHAHLCVYKAETPLKGLANPAYDTHGAMTAGVSKYEACQIENMLDDNDLHYGDGRVIHNGKNLTLDKGFDCAKYPNVGAKGAAGDIGSYCFRIF